MRRPQSQARRRVSAAEKIASLRSWGGYYGALLRPVQSPAMTKVVCFFIHNISNSGGTERVTTLIANQLSRNDYSVRIISMFSDDNQACFELDKAVTIHTLFEQRVRGLFSFPLVFWRLRKKLRQTSADVIINVDSILAFYSIPVSRLPGRRIRNVSWEHFNYRITLGKTLRSVARTMAAKYGDDVVTLTARDKTLWQKAHANLRRVVAIANPAPKTTQRVDGQRHNSKVVVAVGRFTPQKGFDLLIQAFDRVRRARTDWVLQIVGDGEDRDALAASIETLSLTEWITLVPATSDIGSVYRAAGVYVMSSRFEGLPMVLLEAASAGLPIVAFDCDTGPAEIVTPELGWLCEADNPDALASTLLVAMETFEDPSAYQRMSRAASARAEHFDIDRITLKWIELLET